MGMRPIRLLLLCLTIVSSTVKSQCPFQHSDPMHRNARKKGSLQCVVGYPAVYQRHGQGSDHTNGDKIKTGSIARGNFAVLIGGQPLTAGANEFLPGEVLDLTVEGKVPEGEKKKKQFKGVQIVLSSRTKNFANDPNLQPKDKNLFKTIDQDCFWTSVDKKQTITWAGVTHKESMLRDVAEFKLKVEKDKATDDVTLDVNIMVIHTAKSEKGVEPVVEENIEWYYSQYKLKGVAKGNATTTKPTNAPTKDETKPPTLTPGVPTLPPPVVATFAPSPTPIQNPASLPPQPDASPTTPSMEPSHALSPSPDNIPSVAPPRMGIPSTDHPNMVSVWPSTTSTVSSSILPTWTVPPSITAPLPPPTAAAPTTLVSTELCLERCNVGNGLATTHVRTGCAPCPKSDNVDD